MGTETPTEKLHVEGSIKMVDGNQSNGYVLTSDANGVGSWAASAGGGTFTGNTSGDCITDLHITNLYGCSPLHIEPSGLSDVYMVENGGNVAIGHDTPTEKLHVKNGDILVEGSNGKFYSDLDSSVGAVNFISGGTNGLVRLNKIGYCSSTKGCKNSFKSNVATL